jgi:hypothetical protein
VTKNKFTSEEKLTEFAVRFLLPSGMRSIFPHFAHAHKFFTKQVYRVAMLLKHSGEVL